MESKNINTNLDTISCKYGTQLYFEIKMKEMIDSCFTYGGYDKESHNFKRYIFPHTNNLPMVIFEEVYTEQVNFLEKNCIVDRGVYTDSEGCTYNKLSIKK